MISLSAATGESKLYPRVERNTPVAAIWPDSVETYTDQLSLWPLKPLSRPEIKHVDSLCGYCPSNRPRVTTPGVEYPLYVGKRTLYWQCVHLFQPRLEAIHFLMDRGPAIITGFEPAVNWTFADPDGRDHGADYLKWHRVIRYQRHPGIWFEGTYYARERAHANGRTAPTNYSAYSDMPCKLTGEDCVHQEYRLARFKLQTHEVRTLADVLRFDPRIFFRDHLTLYEVDVDKLDRLLRSYHRRIGKPLAVTAEQLCDTHTVEQLVHKYRDKLRIWRALVKLRVTHLLPAHRLY